MIDSHYVYVHRKISDGNIFYVGKGHGYRYKSFSSRSKYWHNVVNKHGLYPEIVRFFKNDSCAFTYEKILINIIGIENLVNLSTGGYGPATGHKWTKEQKINHPNTGKTGLNAPVVDKKMYEFISPEGQLIESTRIELSKKYGLNSVSVTNLVLGDVNSLHGWSIKGRKRSMRQRYYTEVLTFAHESGLYFTGTRKELKEVHGVTPCKSAALVTGSRKQHKGWRIVE